MEKMKRMFLIVPLLLALLLGLLMPVADIGYPATPNPSPASPGYSILPIHISGQYTATATGVFSTKSPYPLVLINAYVTARASGGTSPTLTVTAKQASTTLFTQAVTAGTVSEPTLSSTTIPDEAALTIDFTIGGTSPTWNDITILLIVKRQ